MAQNQISETTFRMEDVKIVDDKPQFKAQEPLGLIDIDSLPERKIGQRLEKPHLDGKTVRITDAELCLSGSKRLTKAQDKELENIYLKVYYGRDDVNGNIFENYGGIARFPDGSISFDANANNATAKLFRKWLQFKGLRKEDVSQKDFFKSLKEDKLLARLKEELTMYQGVASFRNSVEVFLGR